MDIVVNGHKVFCATGGKKFDPEQPSVIMIHGAGMDHTVWFLQARYFSYHGRNFLAVDLPGHGRSEGEALETIPALADWVVHFMDAMGIETAALGGHSMGALTALEAASRAPGRVSALALLGVASAMPVHPALLGAAERNEHLGFDLVNAWAHGKGAHIGKHQSPGLWMMGGCIRLLEKSGPGVLYRDLAACNAYETAIDAAKNVTCPTHFILGDGDMMAPARKAQPLANEIDGAAITVIPDCGHMMMSERPSETTDAMRRIF